MFEDQIVDMFAIWINDKCDRASYTFKPKWEIFQNI